MAVSTRTRFEILKRDSFRCRYCGADPTKGVLHVDHVIAIANEGTDDPANLVTACRDCNLGKAAVPLEARKFAPPQSPDELLEQAEQIRGYLAAQKSLNSAQQETTESLLAQWDDEVSSRWPTGLRGKITNALRLLTIAEVSRAISITAERMGHAWTAAQGRYFSAVLRNSILEKHCSPGCISALARAREAGFNSIKISKDKMSWYGPDKMPNALAKELWAFEDEIRAVS